MFWNYLPLMKILPLRISICFRLLSMALMIYSERPHLWMTKSTVAVTANLIAEATRRMRTRADPNLQTTSLSKATARLAAEPGSWNDSFMRLLGITAASQHQI